MRPRSGKTTQRPGVKKAASGREKSEIADELRAKFGLKVVLEVLGLARATYYYHAGRERVDRYADIRPFAREVFGRTANGCGYRQFRNALANERGVRISRKTANKIMREEMLFCRIRAPKYSSHRGEVGKVAKNLLERDFHAEGPLEKVATDVTEFKQPWGKAYLSPVFDMYNNEVVSWDVSQVANMAQVNRMLDGLFERLDQGGGGEGRETLFHSDQGWQYQQKSYQIKLEEHGVTQSMSRKATCLDNAACEGFFGHLKDEFFRGRRFPDFEAFKAELDAYIAYWNTGRYQECLDGMTPEAFRLAGKVKKKKPKKDRRAEAA